MPRTFGFTPMAAAPNARISRGVSVGAQGMFQTWLKASSGASSSVTTARPMSGT